MERYINATHDQGEKFYLKYNDKGKVVMLNLLRFREAADYSNFKELQPEESISGKEAYQLYVENTLPVLEKSGAKVLFYGKSNSFLIGPQTEEWDAVLLVEHQSVTAFMQFAENADYLKGAGHRTAALEDSRLLPISQNNF